MQNQFLEAMQKMELLVLENTKLWNQLQQGNNTASEQKADHGNQQSKRKKKRVKSTCSVAIESCQYSMALAGIFEGLDHKEGKDLLVNSKPATDAKGANTEVEEVVHNQYLSGVLDHMSDVESLISNIQQFYTILVKSYNSSRNKTSEKASLSGIISVTRLKEALLKINLIDHVFLTETYINTLFASINSNHVSIYGAAYILMVCAKKRFSKKAGIHLVRAVSSLLSMYLIEWTHITSKIKKEDTNQIKQSDLEAEPYMTKFEFDEVVAVLEQEKSNLWQVFDAHVTNKTYDASNRLRKLSNNMKMMVAMKRQMSMNLDPTQKVIRRISEQCPEKFTDELNNQQYELNFHDIIQFTKEYHISPNMLSRLQLHEILLSLSNRQGNNSSTNHLLSKTVNVKSNPSEASTIAKKEAEEEIPQKNDVLEDDSDTASEDSRDVILGQMAMEVEDGEDSASDDDEHHNADSLDISLSGLHAGVLEVHVNFVQFLDFIVLMALRCPLFRDAPSLAAKVRNFLHTMISSQGSGMNRQSVPMNTYNPTLDLMSMQTDVFIEMQQGHDVFDNAVMNYNPYSMDESMHRGGAGYFSVMGATYPYLPNMTMPTNIPPPAYPNSSLPVAVAEAFPDEIDEVDRKIQQNHQITNSTTTTSSGIANLFSFFTSAPKPANPPPDGSK